VFTWQSVVVKRSTATIAVALTLPYTNGSFSIGVLSLKNAQQWNSASLRNTNTSL